MKGGRRSPEEKLRQKCDGEQDPISLEDITDSHFAIRLLEDGHYFCYDARSLKGWFDTGSRINPATNKNFSNANIEKIKKKFRKLGIDGEMEHKLFQAVKRSNSRDLQFLQDTLPFMPYLVNIIYKYGGENLLHFAVNPPEKYFADRGDEITQNIVKLLIELGIDVNHRNRDGYTPLAFASAGVKYENCKILIDAGANVNIASSYGRIPLSTIRLSEGINVNAFQVIKLLLENGSDVNMLDKFGSTPFSKLIWEISSIYLFGNNEQERISNCVKLYIDAGADLNETMRDPNDNFTFAPIPLLIKLNNNYIARILLENGADPNFCLPGQGSPLCYATFEDNITAVKYLLEFGADVNKTFDGQTPLFIAAKLNHLEIAELLLSAGADFFKKADGKTPLDIAKTQKMKNLIIKYSGHPDQLAIYS